MGLALLQALLFHDVRSSKRESLPLGGDCLGSNGFPGKARFVGCGRYFCGLFMERREDR